MVSSRCYMRVIWLLSLIPKSSNGGWHGLNYLMCQRLATQELDSSSHCFFKPDQELNSKAVPSSLSFFSFVFWHPKLVCAGPGMASKWLQGGPYTTCFTKPESSKRGGGQGWVKGHTHNFHPKDLSLHHQTLQTINLKPTPVTQRWRYCHKDGLLLCQAKHEDFGAAVPELMEWACALWQLRGRPIETRQAPEHGSGGGY